MNPLLLNKLSEDEVSRLQHALTPKWTKYIPIQPTPKQTAALLMDNVKEMLYGGAAGGGKSVFLLAAALQYVDRKGYSAILFRKTFTDLMLPGALIPMSKEWLQPYLASGEVHWADKDHRYTFKESGATLTFGYLDARDDHLRYQGAEFSFVGIDECTHIAPESYRYLFSRMRKTKRLDFPLRFRASANPGGPYGDYYYERFFVDNLDEDGRPKRIFLPSGLRDNPHLDQESYRAALAELDPVTREQLENGNWEIRPSGDLFDPSWIVTINAMDVPKGIRWVRFWDLAAIDPKKRPGGRGARDPDWTVGFKLGMHQGIYYIADILKFQKAPGDTEMIIRNTAEADGYQCAIRMEEEPGSAGIANTHRYAIGALQGYDFAGIKNTGSKYDRARPAAAACQSGNVFILNTCRNITDFYAQLGAFPNGVHDDMVDGFSGAFNYFKPYMGMIAPPTPLHTDHLSGRSILDDGRPEIRVRTVGRGSYWHRNMSGRRRW